ncbi:hypothetical protein ABTM11_20085 [Acinetobacter baumannii]
MSTSRNGLGPTLQGISRRAAGIGERGFVAASPFAATWTGPARR